MTTIHAGEVRRSNFESDAHALYCGWVLGLALKHGLKVFPNTDADGNYLPELVVEMPPGASIEFLTVIIPVPPEDWRLA